jgi:hypothetical protein
MHGFVSKLHLYLGWGGAQGSLCGVGQELIEEMIKTGEVKLPYNDTDNILRNVSNVLVSKYKVASEITFEIAKELSVARAAITPPYKIYVKDCIFRGMHSLLDKYKIRRDWKRTPTGRNGVFLVCPLMNMLTYAIDNNSDYLAGHCLEAAKQEGDTCICLLEVFSRDVDIENFPEQDNPEIYRIR